MKKLIFIIFLFINFSVFTQENNTKLQLTEEYLISINCSRNEKNIQKKCAMNEFVKFLNQNLDFDFNNIPIGKYRIIISFHIDKKGIIKNVKCDTKFNELKLEILRALKNKLDFLRLTIEGKGITEGNSRIPIYIIVVD